MSDKFSPLELTVLAVLGRRKMTISQIVEKIYSPKGLESNNVIAGTVRRINRKCEQHELAWFLNSHGGGRAGKTIWRDKRVN